MLKFYAGTLLKKSLPFECNSVKKSNRIVSRLLIISHAQVIIIKKILVQCNKLHAMQLNVLVPKTMIRVEQF